MSVRAHFYLTANTHSSLKFSTLVVIAWHFGVVLVVVGSFFSLVFLVSLVVLVCVFFCVHPILAANLFMQSLAQATDSVSWTEQKKSTWTSNIA